MKYFIMLLLDEFYEYEYYLKETFEKIIKN